ncbi:MAG: iron ABC transporter permease [Deltaproteobacteria bacterium]|nr:iron ABC transporter permease [Deltaproteobacteria bacterium]
MLDMDKTRRKLVLACILGGLWLLACGLSGLLIGSTSIDIVRALNGSGPDAQILLVARLPRVLLAALTGGALASAGVGFQALLRNPLATPFTLGVSSGASLGAASAILLGLDTALLGSAAVPLFALAGAGLAVAVVYMLARRRGSLLSTNTLLLAGVCLAFFFGAVMLFLHYLADFGNSYRMIRWLMGSLDITDIMVPLKVFVLTIIGFILLYSNSRRLNVMSAGEEVAQSRGIDVDKVQRRIYFSGSLLTASVVAATGPIGFVGLVVPHVVRMFTGPDHRVLLPASFFAGAGFLILCDLLARVLIAPTEIPVGVITAILGGPFLVWLLRRQVEN